MFSAFMHPLKALSNYREETVESEISEPTKVQPEKQVAIVQGRHCLAYQRSFCSTCVERCPELGAIIVENGMPRVVTDLCTGCGICHDLCPAPTNAILMMPS